VSTRRRRGIGAFDQFDAPGTQFLCGQFHRARYQRTHGRREAAAVILEFDRLRADDGQRDRLAAEQFGAGQDVGHAGLVQAHLAACDE